MPELTVARTARKAHHCDTRSHLCVETIQPGQRYAHSSLPPNSEMGNQQWWHAKTCAPCAEAYGRPIAAELTQTAPATTEEDRRHA